LAPGLIQVQDERFRRASLCIQASASPWRGSRQSGGRRLSFCPHLVRQQPPPRKGPVAGGAARTMSLAAALIAAVWVGTAHGFAPQAGLIGDDAPAPPPQASLLQFPSQPVPALCNPPIAHGMSFPEPFLAFLLSRRIQDPVCELHAAARGIVSGPGSQKSVAFSAAGGRGQEQDGRDPGAGRDSDCFISLRRGGLGEQGRSSDRQVEGPGRGRGGG